MSDLYASSGVDVKSGYQAVERMKKHIARTNRPEVLGGVGAFAGLFQLQTDSFSEPVLVSGTDGVGTKILVAQEMNQLNTIGIDCVAMCVNDVLAQGAEPLFFLDYVAVGKLNPAKVEQLVAGVAEGCVQAGVALIGGETAEMPGLYGQEEFDMAGFCVGIAEKEDLLKPQSVQSGDVLIGLPSSGLHSNGFSLVREILFQQSALSCDTMLPNGSTLGNELLTPTRIYVKDVLPLLRENLIHGISHITGGGFYENIPRMLPDSLQAKIQVDSWEMPAIYSYLIEKNQEVAKEGYGIFNMGIGMVLAINPSSVALVKARIPDAIVIGTIEERVGEAQVILEGGSVPC